VGSRTRDRVAARAGAVLAGVRLRAGVAVAAHGAVRLHRARADARRRVADPRLVALIAGRADDRRAGRAAAVLAGVGLRAGVPVVAAGGVVDVLAAGRRVAAVVGAGVPIVAVGRHTGNAGVVDAALDAVADVRVEAIRVGIAAIGDRVGDAAEARVARVPRAG